MSSVIMNRIWLCFVRDLVQNHNFARLANPDDTDDFPVEKLASFAIFQMLLNLNNLQSRFPVK